MTNLMLGDCFQKLKELPDNSVDSIVTDPPYGLSFMGKSWDYDVPAQHIWEECLRVLKPGGHLLAFFGTRTYHRGVVKIEDAGFEIRDQIMWMYGSGFPKSHNLKEDWQGWGTALKPANEPIVVARKPLEKGLTVAENVLKWGTGALNIDASRIDSPDANLDQKQNTAKASLSGLWEQDGHSQSKYSPQGRWPANVILDEEAAKVLDEKSGKLTSGKPGIRRKGNDGAAYGAESRAPGTIMSGFGDSGGASRFFYVAKASKSERNAGLEGMPTKKMAFSDGANRALSSGAEEYVTETGGGMNRIKEAQNFHPTVKPIKLMSYLINLVTPPGGIVLDPFMGSGTTGVAAKKLGFSFIGIEREPQYFEIAQKRIDRSIAMNKEYESQLEFRA